MTGASEMVGLLRELVEIESPSDSPSGVAALADRVGRELSSLGLDVEQVPVPGAGPILRARTVVREGRRPIMLLGHLDTVWPVGTLRARPVEIEGDVFRGPGSFDMKAGLVVAVFALRELLRRGPLPALTAFFTPLEEVGCDPYRGVMEAEMRASAAVLGFEPAWPGGAVKTERKGTGSFVLRTRGRAAHAGADFERGANAILGLAQATLDAAALCDAERGITLNVGVVRGGIRPNVIPDHAEAEVDVRFKNLADGRSVEAALRSLKSRTAGVRLEVEGALSYPPLERTAAVRRVYEIARGVAAEIGFPLAEVSTGGASEASFASALGVPTLDGLGADGDGAHAEDEHVLVSSMPQRAALAAGLIERLASP